RAAEDLPFYEMDFDLLQKEGLSIVGDPDYVTREIQAQMRELGAGVIMGLFQFGSLPHESAQKNIRLFAEHVLPALKRDGRNPQRSNRRRAPCAASCSGSCPFRCSPPWSPRRPRSPRGRSRSACSPPSPACSRASRRTSSTAPSSTTPSPAASSAG